MNEDKEVRDFGWAITRLKDGDKVCRAGWNGKGMWLTIVSGYDVLATVEDIEPLPYIGMKTADNKFVPWLASQTDVLAEDWEQVDI